LAAAGPGLSAAERTAVVGELAEVPAYRPEGIFARLALTAGAYVEWGASPLSLAAKAPECTLMTMRLRIGFSDFWPVVGGGRPEPDPDQPPTMTALIGLFRTKANEVGASERAAVAAAIS
jgi:hypothetical protein